MGGEGGADEDEEQDLLPIVKKNFNARRTLHKAIDTVRAINKLREGGGLMMGMMDGAMSIDPKPKPEMVNGSQVTSGDDAQPMEGVAQQGTLWSGGGGANDQGQTGNGNGNGNGNRVGSGAGDAMEIDSRSNARGQTQEQIRVQEKKVKEMVTGLWSRR